MDYTKFLGEVGLTELWNLMLAQLDERIFVGTRAEYDAKASEIPVGCLVIITDESEGAQATSTSAVLGTALLGKMILGQK